MDNFKDTAYRMYEDAEILLNNEKWFNSCYLSGYILECYCKLILDNALTNGIINSRRNVREYSHNISSMERDMSLLLLSESQLSRYCLDLSSKCTNILSTWNPIHRYRDNDTEWNNNNIAEEYKEESDVLIEQILQMELDGVI